VAVPPLIRDCRTMNCRGLLHRDGPVIVVGRRVDSSESSDAWGWVGPKAAVGERRERLPAQEQDALFFECVDRAHDRRIGQRDLAIHPVDLSERLREQIMVFHGPQIRYASGSSAAWASVSRQKKTFAQAFAHLR
jgi:hypothetical protein